MRINPFKSFLLAGVAGLGLATSSASAMVVFMPGNNPQADEENILFTTASGPKIIGTTMSGVAFDFTSQTGQTLQASSSGQAKIETTAGGGPLTSIAMTSSTHNVEDLIVNLMTLSSAATIKVTTTTGETFTDVLPAKSGSNFITVVASGGERISSADFTSSGGFDAFQQPRVSGVTPIPEPSTLVLLMLGFGGLGYAASRRGAKSRPGWRAGLGILAG